MICICRRDWKTVDQVEGKGGKEYATDNTDKLYSTRRLWFVIAFMKLLNTYFDRLSFIL